MAKISAVYEKTYREYLMQLSAIDVYTTGKFLGGKADGDDMIIPLFGIPYRVSSRGISDPDGNQPTLDICVVLSKYLLDSKASPPEEREWVAFRNLKNAGPLTVYFSNDVERAISIHFSGRLSSLMGASLLMGGTPSDISATCDIALQFMALPKVPIVLLFNDRDDEFPTSCSVLFERRAEHFLDAECLSILGRILFRQLKKISKNGRS